MGKHIEMFEVIEHKANDIHAFIVGYTIGSERVVGIVFRGTASDTNLRTDLQSTWITSRNNSFPPGLKYLEAESSSTRSGHIAVHEGFACGLMAVQPDILKCITQLQLQRSFTSVWCIGHSLGGAMATLMSL